MLLLSILLASQLPVGEGPADAAADDALFALESELVATASRASEPLRLAPASITVVPRWELDAFGFASTADALVGVRGLSLTNDKIWPSLGVRGFNRPGDYGNRVQVQIDGHVMNDDWISSSYVSDDQLTDLSMIESIEVLRGPGSALYGTGALFGVINLLTPKTVPAPRLRFGVGLVETLTGRLHVDGGAPISVPVLGTGTAWASVSASGHVPLDYQSDAYLQTPGAEDGRAVGADRLATLTAMAKVVAGDFTLQANHHLRDRGYPTGAFSGVFGDPRNTAVEDRSFVELRYEPVFGDVQLSTRAFFDSYGYFAGYTDESDVTLFSTDDYRSLWGGVEARATAELFDGLRLIAGAQYELHPSVRWVQTDFIDETFVFHSAALYATADWRPTSWLLLGGGARLDARIYQAPVNQPGPAGFLASLNPRLHLLFLPTDEDTVKVLAGRAFRAPSIYELQFSADGFDFQDGAASVAPENVTTFEVEYSRRLPLELTAIAAVYGNVIEGLIEEGSDNDAVDAYGNQAQPVLAAGAEVEVRRNFAAGVLGSAFYTFQRARVGSLIDGDAEVNSPTHLAGIKLLVPISDERLGLGQRLIVDVGRIDREGEVVDPAFIWDVTLSGKASEVAGLTWSVGVRNLLDQRYGHPAANTRDVVLIQPGRNIRAELSFAF